MQTRLEDGVVNAKAGTRGRLWTDVLAVHEEREDVS
jgi:hypothetical protein